jgi:hypothetical protein
LGERKIFSTTCVNQLSKCGVALLLSLTATAGHATTVAPKQGQEQGNSQWVDTFIGTGGDDHTFPGAVVTY